MAQRNQERGTARKSINGVEGITNLQKLLFSLDVKKINERRNKIIDTKLCYRQYRNFLTVSVNKKDVKKRFLLFFDCIGHIPNWHSMSNTRISFRGSGVVDYSIIL